MAILGEATTLLSVEEHVVGPYDWLVGTKEAGIDRGAVNIQTHLVVLQSNQRQIQAWVAVEEEQERQVHHVARAGQWVAAT